jgi:hypothetical protein
MADRFPLIANSSANQIQELAASDNLNLTASTIVSTGIVTVSAPVDISKDIKVGAAATITGALTGSTGTFSGALSGTTGTFSGAVNVDDTTDSTSVTTGSLIIDGGVGIAKNVYIGAGLSVAGTITYEDVTSVDAVGLITAKSGVNVTGGQLQVGVAYSVGAAGVATALGFVAGTSGFTGDLTGDVTGAVTGNSDTCTTATNINASANNSNNETVYPLFVDGATGSQGCETDTGLSYNPSTGLLTLVGLDLSGDVDVDGTLEADAITVNGTALSSYIAGVTVTNATNSAHVYVTDNESTNESNLITFVENGTSSTGNVGLEMDGTLTYNPSTGTVSATGFSGDLTGTLQTAAQTNVTSLGTLSGLTLSGDLFFDNGTNAGFDLMWDASDNALEFDDSVYATFGDQQDMLIFHDGSHAYIRNTTGTLYIQSKTGENAISAVPDGATSIAYDNSYKLETTNDGVKITGIGTFTQGANFDGILSEKFNSTAGKLSDNTNIDLENGMIHFFTTTESTTCTPNIRYNSSKSLNNMLSAGDSVTVTVITSAAAAGYSANWTVDGSAVTEEWNGGDAPSEGGAGGYDCYTITLLKISSGSFTVLANVSNFA